MATEVIKIVDPDNGSGTNYTSLSAWEAGEQGNLTGARDEIAVAKCRCTGGTADTTAVTISGWTTDSTRYIQIWTDPTESYRHNGTYQTSKYRIEITPTNDGANAINISYACYIRIIGLQFTLNWSGSGPGYWFCSSISDNYASANVVIRECIFRQTGTPISYDGHSAGVWCRSQYKIINCIFYGYRGGTSDPDYSYGVAGYASTQYIYNCTFYDCRYGIRNESSSSMIAKNCLTAACTDGFDGTITTSYCATDLAEGLSGTGDRNSQTFSFVSTASKDFHLTSSDTGAKDYGTNLYDDAVYPFQTDIDGQDRGGSGAQWDIGADKYLNSSLPPQLLTPQRSIQHLLVR